MAKTRAFLLLFASLYLLSKFTPRSHPHQSFQKLTESLTIFKSNHIQPIADNIISEDTFPFSFEESDVSPDPRWPDIDENDVVALTDQNFKQFVDKNEYVMVMFYAQWCYWSRKLAPDFVGAAQFLKSKSRVVFAMVDASVETKLRLQYQIEGYPTMYLFVDGVNRHIYNFSYDRSRDAIVSWLQEKVKIGIQNITTMEEAVHVFNSESMLVLGVVDSLEGSDSEELAAAANMQTDINFYQTANLNVAEFFHFAEVKRPTLLLKRSGQYYQFDGRFTRSEIVDFVSTRKHPPVITFTYKDATSIFESPLKQLWLFAPKGTEVVSTFGEAAEEFRGKLLFVHLVLDGETSWEHLSFEFGVTGDALPVVGYSDHNVQKHILHGELSLNNIKAFAEDLLQDNGLLQSSPVSVLKLPSHSHDGRHPRRHPLHLQI